MNINEILKGFKCSSCQREHKCQIESVYIEGGAISRLSEIAKDYKKILLVADENTYEAAGAKTEEALKNKIQGRVIFSGRTVLIPDERAIESVNSKVGDSDLIVLYKHSEQTLIMVLLKLIQLWVKSVLKFGFSKVT